MKYKYEIEFEEDYHVRQFKKFLKTEYMERELEAYKYGIGIGSTLTDTILSVLQ